MRVDCQSALLCYSLVGVNVCGVGVNTFDKENMKTYFFWVTCFVLLIATDAANASGLTIGGMASSITNTFESITKLITAGSYIAGLGFSIGAIMKFKQHKENPTQIPIGTPISLVFIASSLLFLPSILSMTGYTMFGPEGGTTATPHGTVFS